MHVSSFYRYTDTINTSLNAGSSLLFKRPYCNILITYIISIGLFAIQVWMVVQRKWMYLESIFIGGDIRAQLPEEARKFDDIDKTFKKVSIFILVLSNI